MRVSPESSYVEILPCCMMVAGGGPLGGERVLRYSPCAWDQSPYKGDPTEPPAPTTRQEDGVCEPGHGSLHAWDLPPP